MKELFGILRANRSIMIWVLIVFLLVEITGYFRLFFVASFFFWFVATKANLNLFGSASWRVLLLFTMFATYWLLGVNEFHIGAFMFFMVPSCMLFMIGRSVVLCRQEDSYYVGLFLAIGLCTGFYNIVVSISDMFRVGIFNIDVYADWRSLRDDGFRTSSLIVADLEALISCFALYFVSSINVRLRTINKLGWVLALVAFVCALHFVSRTSVVIAIVSVLCGLIFMRSNKQRNTIWIFLGLLVAVYLFFNSGFWEMMSYKNEFGETLTGNGRTYRQLYWLGEVMKNPFGVANYRNQDVFYAHNFWIDFAKDAGWIPGICLLWFSILNLKDAFGVIKSKKISSNVRMIVASMTAAFTLGFSVEPIFGGADNSMLAYFLFCGMVSSLNQKRKYL